MKRIVLLAAVAGSLAGCLEAQPSPALARLQGACEAGNLQACEVVVAQEEARKAAFLQYWANRPPVDVYTSVPVTPLATPTTTNCRPDFLGGMRCTTY